MEEKKNDILDTTTKQVRKTRPTKWETTILPQKDLIIQQLKSGASEQQIYVGIGVGRDAWINAKKAHPEMQEWINEARCNIVGQLKGALFKKAMGFTYA